MLFGAAGAVLYSAVFLPLSPDHPALYFNRGLFFILSEKFFDIFKNDSEQKKICIKI